MSVKLLRDYFILYVFHQNYEKKIVFIERILISLDVDKKVLKSHGPLMTWTNPSINEKQLDLASQLLSINSLLPFLFVAVNKLRYIIWGINRLLLPCPGLTQNIFPPHA